jgi:hypothetical protein
MIADWEVCQKCQNCQTSPQALRFAAAASSKIRHCLANPKKNGVTLKFW